MTELSAEKLAGLREIAEAATGGDWAVTEEEEDTDFGVFTAYGVSPVTELRWVSDSHPATLTADPLSEDDARHIAAFDPETVLTLLDLIAEQQAELAQVEAFINQRPEYVAALKNTRGGDSTEDYYRWSGHAEARRQLATSLNLTTPYEPGEKATRYEVTDDE